jgi:hypothetical protein
VAAVVAPVGAGQKPCVSCGQGLRAKAKVRARMMLCVVHRDAVLFVCGCVCVRVGRCVARSCVSACMHQHVCISMYASACARGNR